MVVVATGLLLAWAEPVRLYGSPSFWVKVSLFALIGLHALVFRPKVAGHPDELNAGVSSKAKLAAALSLILLGGVVVSGRHIAFDASFEHTSLIENQVTNHALAHGKHSPP